MALMSGVMAVVAMQATPTDTMNPPPPPVDKVACILATLAVGEPAGSPLTVINYFESGVVRIERELPTGQTARNTDDLILQLDGVWYAQGRAVVNQGAAAMLQVTLDNSFAYALPNARSFTLWDETAKREQFDVKAIDRSTLDSWRTCVASVPTPQPGLTPSSSRYRPQAPLQVVNPLNRASWITSDDYPSRLLRMELSGTVSYALDVSVNGRVKNCTTDNSYPTNADGTPNHMLELNAATCRLITRRARFQPATDANGRPIAARSSGRVRWTLPYD